MKKLSWFVFLSFIAFSCLDQPDCFQLNNDTIVINFKVIGFSYDIVAFKAITISGTDRVVAGDTVSSVTLPLNPLDTHIDYAIKTTNGDSIIRLDYKRQVQFVSSDCGERYIFSDLNVIDSNFDSVNVVNGTPTTNPSSNIDIFRCAVTNLMGITFDSDVIVKTVTGDYDNTVFYANDTLFASKIYTLPLNVENDSTSFLFTGATGTPKKLTVTYSNTLKVFAARCGVQHILEDVANVESDYKTVKVSNPKIQDLPVSNFAITP